MQLPKLKIIKQASINLKNNVDHCHLLKFLADVELSNTGRKINYNIYLD